MRFRPSRSGCEKETEDAQAKATKRQSDKLFLWKEAEARAAKRQSDELLRRREAEAKASISLMSYFEGEKLRPKQLNSDHTHSRMQKRGDREKPRKGRGNIEVGNNEMYINTWAHAST